MRTCIVRILEIIIEIRRQVVACPRLIFFFFFWKGGKSDFLAFLLSSQESVKSGIRNELIKKKKRNFLSRSNRIEETTRSIQCSRWTVIMKVCHSTSLVTLN